MRGKDQFHESKVALALKTGKNIGDKQTCLSPLPTALRMLPILCASFIYAGAWFSSFPAIAADDNKQQLKSIQQDIAEKEKAVKQQQQQRSSLQDQLKAQEKIIAQASRSLRETQYELAALSANVTKLTASIKKLQSQENKHLQLLEHQLDMAFRLGKHTGIQVLLSGEESQRSERILAYFGYLNEARQKNIDKLNQTRTELASEKKALEAAQNQQKAILITQKQAQQQLESARIQRQKTLSSLESALAKDQQQLSEMKANESRLRDQIAKAEREAKARAEREAREAAKLQAQMKAKEEQAKKKGTTYKYKPTESERSLIARTGGLGRGNGQALWPVRGRTIHSFGETLQGELRWKGMVIAASEGSEVKAIADGRVLLADWLQGYGLVVVVEHGKGDMSLYGYNQSALVNVGAQVRAGQPIALVGNSGGQGQPALYFEIRRQGQAVNPLPWLGR